MGMKKKKYWKVEKLVAHPLYDYELWLEVFRGDTEEQAQIYLDEKTKITDTIRIEEVIE